MDIIQARSVSLLIDDCHDDLNNIYEKIVDEESTASKAIDALIAKLRVIKTNLVNRDENFS